MKRSLVLLFLIAAALPGAAQSTTRYMVGTQSAGRAAAARMLQTDAAVRAHAVRAFDNLPAFAATLTADEAAALRASSGVRFVTPVVERHLLDATVAAIGNAHTVVANGSPYKNAQAVPYGIDMVNARDVWPVTRGKGPVHVVVFDTGIDLNHPDLKHVYAGGFNTFDATLPPADENRHGTHVSGIIGATDNNFGVVGVAPDVELWMVKILDGGGRGTDENVVSAIDWTLQKKAQLGGNWIVSMSFGSGSPSDAEAEGFQKLVAAGVLPIAAAGNSGFSVLDYPAAYPGVFSVGAIDSKGNMADFSSFGSGLGIVAPGVDVLSTVPVGSVPSAGARLADGVEAVAATLIGSKRADVTAPLVFCGYGRPEDIPANVAGKIALMERGMNITFSEKVRNVVAAGAVGAAIYNFADSVAYTTWTLIRPDCGPDGCVPFADDVNFNWPVVVAMPTDEGKHLRPYADANATITIGTWNDDYTKMSGTSMAAPHVSGVAALLWCLAPSARATDIRNAISLGADDILTPGVDLHSGWGIIDALAAAKLLNPGAFGISPTTPVPGPHRRSTRP